ncbi:MAG: DUF2807 domain-containing protein [Hyphomonadaceae bacterium]|nr:DUF2807 domain-containing protein [Hyphomonadaceae bacterium]
MERFVFVAAVTIAVIFGIGAVFGGPNFHFSFDDDEGLGTAELVTVAPGRMDAQVFAGTDLRLKATAAVVTIVPEDRTDFSIEIDNSAGRAPLPVVTVNDGRINIDGQLRGRIGNCSAESVDLRGYGDIATAELPRITIRAPRTLDIRRGGAGPTEIGPTQELNLDISGCGDTTIGDVAGELNVDNSGSGEVTAGSAGSLDLDLAGSGDVTVGAVANGADIDSAGSGTITLAALTGELASASAGSGSLLIQGGSISDASVAIAGSGDAAITASIQSLDVAIAGSGDVTVTGPVEALEVSIGGSGDVDVNGVVGDVDAEIAGSGTVSVQSVTGSVREESWGSGDVIVGGQSRDAQQR